MKYLKLWFESDDKVEKIGREEHFLYIESITTHRKQWTRDFEMERKRMNDSDYDYISEERAKAIIERIKNA